ncbi:hypothetical protein K438DRAFT_1768765 [Mycena galopus ATCC 62051]|nr:hypothetical protein K438DRAFT_1768765 [Mycena galopus ATCC 62051]
MTVDAECDWREEEWDREATKEDGRKGESKMVADYERVSFKTFGRARGDVVLVLVHKATALRRKRDGWARIALLYPEHTRYVSFRLIKSYRCSITDDTCYWELVSEFVRSRNSYRQSLPSYAGYNVYFLHDETRVIDFRLPSAILLQKTTFRVWFWRRK